MRINYILTGLVLLTSALSVHAQCKVMAQGDTLAVCDGISQLHVDGVPEDGSLGGGPQNYAQSIFFVSNDIGFAAGGNMISKTVDGGKNWTVQQTEPDNSFTYRSVYFTNTNTGYAVGYTYIGSDYLSKIMKTTDGGNSWTEQKSIPSIPLYGVQFKTDSIGYISAFNGAVYKTVDAGQNWVKKKCNTTENLLCLYFVNTTVGYAGGGGGSIFKTTDGGETWTLSGKPSYSIMSVYFTSENVGCMAASDGIYRTTNGGLQWNRVNYNIAFCVFFTDANTGYAGARFNLYKTTDGGATWRIQPLHTYMRVESIHFPSLKVGYIGGGYEFQPYKKVLRLQEPDVVTWSPATGLNSATIAEPLAIITKKITYTVNAITNGCPSKDSVKIDVIPLTAEAGSDKTLVCGASVQLDSVTSNYTNKTGVLSYSWTPANGLSSTTIANPVASPVKTTKYYVTVSTPNGCSVTDSVTVIVAPFTADAGNDATVICGSTAQLSVSTNYTGLGALNYSWSPATGLNAVNISNPMAFTNHTITYSVIVTTPNGCSTTDSVQVIVDPLTADAGSDETVICGSTAQLNVSTNYTGSGTLNYSWSPATGLNATNISNPMAFTNHITTYSVTVTTPNGCPVTDSVQVSVTPLKIDAGIDKSHVCGGSVLLQTSTNSEHPETVTYQWLPLTGLSDHLSPAPYSSAGPITYTVIATSSGCTASDEISVTLAPLDVPQICMVGMDSTGKNSVMWNAQAGASVIKEFNIYRETTVAGNFVKIGTAPGTAKRYRDLNSDPRVKSNRYKISVVDTCGVETPQSSYHKTMHLAITKGIGTSWNLIWEHYEGFSVPTYNIYRGTSSSNLQFHDAVSGGSNQYTDYNPPPGDLYYQVEVVNPQSCDAGISAGILRSNVASNNLTGIYENKLSPEFMLFPNPASDAVTILVEQPILKDMTLEIYNSIGLLVKKIAVQQSTQQLIVEDLSNGMYLIELKSANGSSRKKITIQK